MSFFISNMREYVEKGVVEVLSRWDGYLVASHESQP